MTAELSAQAVSLATALLLVTAIVQVWRRSLLGSVQLLAVQGYALAAVIALVGWQTQHLEVVAVALLVGAVKGWWLPWLLARTARTLTHSHEEPTKVHAATGVLISAGLVLVAFVVARPLVAIAPAETARNVPCGLALVFLGFLQLVARHRALSQLVGFVVLDNGIGAVSYLLAGGVPLVVELGVTLDVICVVLILRVLTHRMRATDGVSDLDDLRELAD